jgi:hypothetical protein
VKWGFYANDLGVQPNLAFQISVPIGISGFLRGLFIERNCGQMKNRLTFQ